ncbi:EF-hand calcium-binding domain-containing protein 7 [Bulinus truncatus]|nr:EF-hand calcium-binding domain-containing protein 7 [Bulinus truncatus]
MSRRLSRPSSAASNRPRTAGQAERELRLECQAVFLGHYDDLKEKIDSKEDLILLLQQTGRNPTSKTISKYWTARTESMTFEDFVDVCNREPITSEEDLMKAFRKIDLNGDGYISLDELLKILTTKGEKMSRAEVKELIDDVDENKDGKLDYKEFSKMVLSTTDEYKKLALRNLDRIEKSKKLHGDTSPRKEKDDLDLGSQMSVRSSASDWRPSQERRLSKQSVSGNILDEASALSKRRSSTLSHVSNDDLSRPSPRVGSKSSARGGRSKEPTNLKYSKIVTPFTVNVTIAVVWTGSVLFAILPIVGLGRNVERYPGTWCFFDDRSTDIGGQLLSYFYAIAGLLSIGITIVLNILVIQHLWRMRRSRLSSSVKSYTSSLNGSRKRFNYSMDSETRMVIFLMAIIVVFTVCYAPWMVSLKMDIIE